MELFKPGNLLLCLMNPPVESFRVIKAISSQFSTRTFPIANHNPEREPLDFPRFTSPCSLVYLRVLQATQIP